jgi:hypothetical protein
MASTNGTSITTTKPGATKGHPRWVVLIVGMLAIIVVCIVYAFMVFTREPTNLKQLASKLSVAAPTCHQTASDYTAFNIDGPPGVVLNFQCAGGYDEIEGYLSKLIASDVCVNMPSSTGGGPGVQIVLNCSGGASRKLDPVVTIIPANSNDAAFASGSDALPTDNPKVSVYSVLINDNNLNPLYRL